MSKLDRTFNPTPPNPKLRKKIFKCNLIKNVLTGDGLLSQLVHLYKNEEDDNVFAADRFGHLF